MVNYNSSCFLSSVVVETLADCQRDIIVKSVIFPAMLTCGKWMLRRDSCGYNKLAHLSFLLYIEFIISKIFSVVLNVRNHRCTNIRRIRLQRNLLITQYISHARSIHHDMIDHYVSYLKQGGPALKYLVMILPSYMSFYTLLSNEEEIALLRAIEA